MMPTEKGGSKFILGGKDMGIPPQFLLDHCQPQPCIWSSIVLITLLNGFSGHLLWFYKSMLSNKKLFLSNTYSYKIQLRSHPNLNFFFLKNENNVVLTEKKTIS
jgi:hypothetical protein